MSVSPRVAFLTDRLKILRDGRYRAVIGAHADHATGTSRSRRTDAHS